MNTITILICAVIFIIGFILGVIANSFYQNSKKEELFNDKIIFEKDDMETLRIEWQTTLNTQMHFNDLIIRFRSTVLSVFIAALGFIYGFSKQANLNKNDFLLLMILALTFWLCCFLMDYFYYYKLLLGAVKHAQKFDGNEEFKKRGLFGLTNRISSEIKTSRARIFIWAFYLLPIILLPVIFILRR